MTRRRKLITVAAASFALIVGGGGAVLTATSCGCAALPETKAPPAVAGTATVGGTLTTSNGLWVTSGSLASHPNTSYSYQWLTCTSAELLETCANAPGAGATTSTYTIASADAGNYLRAQVTATNDSGNTSEASAATSSVPAGDYGATGYRVLVQPAFTPTTTVTATTPTQFATDITSLVAGEQLDVNAMTISGNFNVTENLASYAEVHFAPGVIFSGPTSGGLYDLNIQGATNIRFYGGEIQNPTNGPCVRMFDAVNVLWWHFALNHCGGNGFQIGAPTRNSTGLDLDGTISDVAMDPEHYDPHPEICTGSHGVYIGGGPNNFWVEGKFSIAIDHNLCGAGIQVGCDARNEEFWVKDSYGTMPAQSQTGGNVIQFWSDAGACPSTTMTGITVHDAVGDHISGRVVDTDSAVMSGDVVEYGRCTYACMMNPNRTNYPLNTIYDPISGLTYQDVAPNPYVHTLANTGAPTITGTATQGNTLTVNSTGSWTGSPTSYEYQWQRCNAGVSTGPCWPVHNATSSTYQVGSGDVGDTLRVVVTAYNATDGLDAFSAQTATVS